MTRCTCDPGHTQTTRLSDGTVVCLSCWETVRPERRSQFGDRTTWSPEFRAGVMAALEVRNRIFLAQCEELYNKSNP